MIDTVEISSGGFMNAATIVCIRRSLSRCQKGGGGRGEFEVLLGQNECKNWLRSTPDKDVIMRYPGEWKFPGGVVDDGDQSFKHTAMRELHEEFIGMHLPSQVAERDIILFNTKLTRPIKDRRYRMFNFVALIEDPEADWIADSAIAHINSQLSEKRAHFKSLLASGEYWTKTTAEKATISPEVYRVKWFNLEDAIRMMDDDTSFVDGWQQQSFKELGITGRDPMHVTAESLCEVRDHEDLNALRAAAQLYQDVGIIGE